MATRCISLTLPLFTALAGPAAGQDSAPYGAEPDTSYLAGEVESPALGMTLEQVIALAAANSPTTRGALADLQAARGTRMREAGRFDPQLAAESEQVSTDSPVTSPFAGSELRQRRLSGGLSWLSPIGTSLILSLGQVKTETNAPFTTLPRERRASARLDFVQPLLRGFGLEATRGELRALDRELDAARRRYEGAVLGLAIDVEDAYWELYAAERDLGARRLQRQRAASFVREQVLRGRAGVVGPGAVAAARTFLAEQEALLIATRLRARDASDRLTEVMGVGFSDHERIHALDEPAPPPALEPLGLVLSRAFGVNTDLRAAQQDSAAARARYRRAAWNAWPTLEVFGGYGGAGLAGTSRPVVFGSDTVGTIADTDFGVAWDQVWDDDFPDWNVGLRLSMGLGWRAERGERMRQKGLYERARESLRAQRLLLESQVRSAYREAQTANEALASMRTLVAAALEQARIVRLEYQAGRATAYDLVDLEAEVAQAELLESQTLVRVARSFTRLRRLTQPAPQRAP